MGNRKIYFVSGLPRSGSTLIQNVLCQNPNIYTTPTSACHDIMFEVRNFWDKAIEHKASKELSSEKSLQRVLNSILYSYHDTERPIVVDKGRGWMSLIEMAEFAMNSKAKIICPVRNVSEILASFEKIHRKNCHRVEDFGNYIQSQTTEGRCTQLLKDDMVVGLAYNRLRDVFVRGLQDRLCLVEFDELTVNPTSSFNRIYDFLELPRFSHNFNNVKQSTFEDDSIHGMDLHTIRPTISPVPHQSDSILTPHILKMVENSEFWRNL